MLCCNMLSGWTAANCDLVGTELICTATCKANYVGQPTASCDTTTGEWSPTSGRCTKTNNGCSNMPPPGTPVPPNSLGKQQLCELPCASAGLRMKRHVLHGAARLAATVCRRQQRVDTRACLYARVVPSTTKSLTRRVLLTSCKPNQLFKVRTMRCSKFIHSA
jgi:hypothetical protein